MQVLLSSPVANTRSRTAVQPDSQNCAVNYRAQRRKEHRQCPKRHPIDSAPAIARRSSPSSTPAPSADVTIGWASTARHRAASSTTGSSPNRRAMIGACPRPRRELRRGARKRWRQGADGARSGPVVLALRQETSPAQRIRRATSPVFQRVRGARERQVAGSSDSGPSHESWREQLLASIPVPQTSTGG